MVGCENSASSCRYVSTQRYPIKEKDIIKFGKQKIRIREIVLNDSNPSGVEEFGSIRTNKKIYEDLKLKEGAEQNNVIAKEDFAQEVVSVVTES